MTSEDHLTIARRYLAALENGATGDALAAFFAPDAVQEEFPNRLTPHGARRGVADLLAGAERGKQVMSHQVYTVVNEVTCNDTVVLEVLWSGTLAVPLGSLPAGSEMRARFAVFVEFQDGKIIRQRNYDCFDPW
jgi:ketosteroid isomerase-like protein